MSNRRRAALRATEWQGVAPTRQTKAKLTPDVLLTLKATGRLDEQQVLAGVAIRTAFERLTADVACRVAEYQSGGKPPRRMPPPRWLKAIDHPEVQLYLDWVDEMGKQKMATGPIIDVIVDGLTCKEVDRRRNKRNGDTAVLICDGLEVAVEIGLGTRS